MECVGNGQADDDADDERQRPELLIVDANRWEFLNYCEGFSSSFSYGNDDVVGGVIIRVEYFSSTKWKVALILTSMQVERVISLLAYRAPLIAGEKNRWFVDHKTEWKSGF